MDQLQTTESNGVAPHDAQKRGRGRPAKITEEVVERIANRVSKGLTIEESCLLEDPPVKLASLKTARHRRGDFETLIQRGKAEYLDRALDVIAAGKPGWQSTAWLVERRFRDRFGRNSIVVSADSGASSSTIILTDEIQRDLAKYARENAGE